MRQPQATDGILGGQTPLQTDSAILGGIVGLRQQMSVATTEQRSHLLSVALNYGTDGIDLLLVTLNNDPVLTVRAAAYHHLQTVAEQSEPAIKPVQQAISKGIRFTVVHEEIVDRDTHILH
jgi:hypothetical protein